MMNVQVLATQEYVGRMLCLGRDPNGNHDIIVYAITGRSPSSRARRLEETKEGWIRTAVTDPAVLEKGNPKLLIYNCVRRMHEKWFVSNGAQTDLLVGTAQKKREQGHRCTPLELLVASFGSPHWVEGNQQGEFIDLTAFEPDAPTYTPRISGILGRETAAMAICKQNDGAVARSYFEIPLQAGQGHLLSTYTGQNVPSGEGIPSFQGEPLSLSFPWETPQQTAEAFYEVLGPKTEGPELLSPGADFRIGVAVTFIHRTQHRVASCLLNVHG